MDGKLDEIAVYSGHLVALYCDRHNLRLSTVYSYRLKKQQYTWPTTMTIR